MQNESEYYILHSLNNWQIARMLIDAERFKEALNDGISMSEVVRQYNTEGGFQGCVVALYDAMNCAIEYAMRKKHCLL